MLRLHDGTRLHSIYDCTETADYIHACIPSRDVNTREI